jgi:hypothetical protein
MKSAIFWVVTLCTSAEVQSCFGGLPPSYMALTLRILHSLHNRILYKKIVKSCMFDMDPKVRGNECNNIINMDLLLNGRRAIYSVAWSSLRH